MSGLMIMNRRMMSLQVMLVVMMVVVLVLIVLMTLMVMSTLVDDIICRRHDDTVLMNIAFINVLFIVIHSIMGQFIHQVR